MLKTMLMPEHAAQQERGQIKLALDVFVQSELWACAASFHGDHRRGVRTGGRVRTTSTTCGYSMPSRSRGV